MLALRPGIFCRTAPRVSASELRQHYVGLGVSIAQSWCYTGFGSSREDPGSGANSWTKRGNDATLRDLGVAIDLRVNQRNGNALYVCYSDAPKSHGFVAIGRR
jgi:hypothetical protein